jgi:hypothetical protein
METLLTLSVGEYSSVEVLLHLVVALIGMTAVLLALTATTLQVQLRLPLFLSAVALGGAAWFESGVWQSWQEAFELAGTSYCATGHLIADEYRIIAWSLGVPAILFSSILVQTKPAKTNKSIIWLGVILLLMALIAPFSIHPNLPLLMIAWVVIHKRISMTPETPLLWGSILVGISLVRFHPSSLGGGPSSELVRGEILRTVIDLFSLVIPALLLLIGVLRLSKTSQE